MKKTLISAAAVIVTLSASSAMAWEGETVACFEKEMVGPTYATAEVLVKPAKEQYEHKNGRIELVRYKAVYREVRTKLTEGRWVMKEVMCKKW